MSLQIHRAVDILFDDQVVELRILNAYRDGRRCGTVSGYFDSDHYDDLVAAAEAYTAPAVYWTLNPVLPDLLARSANKVTEWCRITTSDAEVVRRRWLPIDFDPVRPTGVSATDAEHQAALDRAAECRAWLQAEYDMVGVLADSGNGAHLLYRIDLPPDDASVKAFLESLAERFDDNVVKLDRKVFNPARIWKVYGTWARKGDSHGERVHREAQLLDAPEALGVCGIPTGTLAPQNLPSGGKSDSFDVPAFLKSHGVAVRREKPWEGGRLWEVDCPWKSEDTYGKGAVIQLPSGAVTFSCRHDKCTGGWKEYRSQIDPLFRESQDTVTVAWERGCAAVSAMGGALPPVVGEPELYLTRKGKRLTVAAARPAGPVPEGWSAKSPAARTITWTCEIDTANGVRSVDDPLRLAEAHLEKWDRNALTCFHGDTYRYSSEEGWLKTSEAELAPWIRATIQEEFDKADHTAPVTKTLVANVFLAMQQLVMRAVPMSAQPPFWLGGNHTAAPTDLLCFKNGILNLRACVTAEPEPFMALTPQLFYEHQAAFDVDLSARAPVWQSFLDSLEQDNEWYALLQEAIGYTLWSGYSLHKLFQLVGPPRSGKSTITDVMKALLGGSTSTCSLKLVHFADEFGLEQAVGKKLILVPEIAAPDRSAHQIVNNIKAITGGDEVAVNRKNIKIISSHIQGTIWFVTNNFVALPDSSGALHSRLIPIKMTKSFLGREDIELGAKLVPEYPGILNWALEGLRRLWAAKGRFTIPQSTTDTLDELTTAAAPLHDFVSDTSTVDTRAAVESVGYYRNHYLPWHSETYPDDEPLTPKQFAEELRTTLPTVTKKRIRGTPESCSGRLIVYPDPDGCPGRPVIWLGVRPKAA